MRFSYTIICLFIFINSLAQTPANELLRNLNGAKTDSQRVTAYKRLIAHYKYLDIDSATYYAEQGVTYFTGEKNVTSEASMVQQLAMIDKSEGRVDIARQRFNYALTLFRQENYAVGIADALSGLGVLECENGNFDIGVKDFFAVLRIEDSLKDDERRMTTYLNLGGNYLAHDDTANAAKYLQLGNEVSKNVPLEDISISLYNTMAILYIGRGDTEKGLQTFLHDLELSNKPQFTSSHIECLQYLGNFYLDKNMPDKALSYLQEGLTAAERMKMPEEQANISLLIAVVVKQKNPQLALDYLERAKNLCDSIKNRVYKLYVYTEMIGVYKEQGNFKEALRITDDKQRLNDTIYTVNKAKEIASLGATYELEKSNVRVTQLETLSNRNAMQRNIIIAVTLVIIIVLVILLFYFRQTKNLNRQLITREKELEELNSMKDKLFSVIGHDLRGPIARIPTIIDMYEDAHTSEEEKNFLLNSLREQTKSSLETFDKLLYWGLTLVKGVRINQLKMQPKTFIAESIQLRKIKAAEKNIRVIDNTPANLYVFADPTHFDFVVRNLLANALKYTYQNGTVEIGVDTIAKPGFAVFMIKDTGTGIDKAVLPTLFNALKSSEGTEHEKGTGIGLMLCKEFVTMNGGDIWVESEPGKGATFYFSVKSVS